MGGKVEGGVEAQAKQALKNMKSIIEAGGSEVGKVVKTTVRFLILPLVSSPSLLVRCRTTILYTSDGLAGRSHNWHARMHAHMHRCSSTPWTTSSP